MRHSLPKAISRKNVQLPGYVPEGRLFGAFTTRGEGITQATYRYPKVVQAIHHLASLRGGEASCEGYLSAQINRAKRLQVHKDKNNHSTSWLIALGDFTGGRLWLEDPLGQHPPPNVTSEWQKSLRGSYYNVHNTWFKFDPTKYHAVEEVKSGTRTSVALFSPRSWKRIPPHALTELADVVFIPQSQLCELRGQGKRLLKEKQRMKTYGWNHLLLINNRSSPTHLLRRRQSCKNCAVKIMCHFLQTP